MLMSAELKGCFKWFVYFLGLLYVRYNCAKFHLCGIFVTDFREGRPFCTCPYPPPPATPYPWAALKRPILNRVKKVDRNLLKDWQMKVNAFLTEVKSDYIIETNKLIRACFIFLGKKVGLKPNQRRGNPVKVPWWK